MVSLLLATPASAQALGSVHCKASLREIDISVGAAQRKSESVQTKGLTEKCSAMRVEHEMLKQQSVILGRCTTGDERDAKTRIADTSAADLQEKISEGCGG